jgi:hypothetical protein
MGVSIFSTHIHRNFLSHKIFKRPRLTVEYTSLEMYTYGIYSLNFLENCKIYGERVLDLKWVFQFSPHIFVEIFVP